MESGSFSPLAHSSLPLEATEARDFGSLMVSDGVEYFSGEASAFSGFRHLGVPFDIFSVGSTLPTACSTKTASCPLLPWPSSEELDVLDAELKLIRDALMEDVNAGNASLAEIGFGQDNSFGNTPRSAKKPSLEEGFAEQKCTDIAMVSVDLIQNKRPFKCSYFGCEKTFKNPQTLKMHSKTHCSDDVPLQPRSDSVPHACKAGQNKKVPCRCPICGGTFVGLYELRRHFGRKHSKGEKMHCCEKCGKKFYVEVDLRDHLKLCGEPLGCKCGMKFAFRCNLLAHKKAHPECM
ncbi:unnamed protein product [Victoria cruziana]